MDRNNLKCNIDNFKILYKLNSDFLAYLDEDLVFVVNSNVYHLSSSPFEPCLYIKVNDKICITIHNSFSAIEISNLAESNSVITLISGNEYNIKGICELLLCAIKIGYNSYDISYLEGCLVIDKLINIGATSKENSIKLSNISIKNDNIMNSFIHSKKIKKTNDGKFFVELKDNNVIEESYAFIELIDDPFYKEYKNYDDCVLDYCIIKPNIQYNGSISHKDAVLFAMKKWSNALKKDYDLDIYCFPDKMESYKIDANTFFELTKKENIDELKPYWYLFLNPPHGTNYTINDFIKINNILFPNGKEQLEIFEWNVDWSNYFEEGLEWWGARCVSIYDKTLNRFVIIGASATD